MGKLQSIDQQKQQHHHNVELEKLHMMEKHQVIYGKICQFHLRLHHQRLHGDLHHDNILRNDDDWVVIDPKGVIGTPMNEIWAFVKDIKRDIPFIAQYFHFRTQDLFDWYFVHLILAICWNLEDNLDTTLFIKLAEKAYKYIS